MFSDPSFFHIVHKTSFKRMTDKLCKSCAGDNRLYILNAPEKILLPQCIQFRKHVVQKKYRLIPGPKLYKFYFRKLHGKRTGPLLPLGAENPGVQFFLAGIFRCQYKTDIIPVRTDTGGFCFQILIPVFLEILKKIIRLGIFLVKET